MNDKNKNVQRTLVNQNGKLCEEVSRGGITSTMPVDITLKEDQKLDLQFGSQMCSCPDDYMLE